MLGLVLEGGGAKGAYHAGAVKALMENGYDFDGVMGTSIGALNGVMIAQNDFEECYRLWYNINPSQILDLNDNEMEKYFEKRMDFSSYKYFYALIKNTLRNRGLSIDKIVSLLKDKIDEDKLRSSGKDFGLITVNMTDGFEPMEVFVEEIPYGMVPEYIMASAYYPAFRNDQINGKRYMDGGTYDNIPINPLIRRGYDHIIAIRTMSYMPHQKVVDETVKVEYICPSEDLGDTLAFSQKITRKNLQLGYYDAMRFIHKFAGRHYYVKNDGEKGLEWFLSTLSPEVIEKAREVFKLRQGVTVKELAVTFLNRLSNYFKISTEATDFERIVIGMEFFARKYRLPKFHIYTIEEFVSEIIKAHKPERDRQSDFRKKLSKFFDSKVEFVFNIYLDNMALKAEKENNGNLSSDNTENNESES